VPQPALSEAVQSEQPTPTSVVETVPEQLPNGHDFRHLAVVPGAEKPQKVAAKQLDAAGGGEPPRVNPSRETTREFGHHFRNLRAVDYSPRVSLNASSMPPVLLKSDANQTAQAKNKIEFFNLATSGAPTRLPFLQEMEFAFNQDLAGVSAFLGNREARDGLGRLGAVGAASGERVAFRSTAPSRALVAHEVAHVVQARSGTWSGDAEAEAERAAGLVASGQRPDISVGVTDDGPHLKPGDEFPGDTIKALKAVDPSGVAPAVAQVAGAVRDLAILKQAYETEAMFEGGPNKHEWWNLWGLIGTTEKQHKAEELLEMAAKASECATALTELGTGISSIVAGVQQWASSLPDVAPEETLAGETAEKLEHVGKVLSWVNTFTQTVNTIGKAVSTSHKLAEFKHNPNSKTAEEWAVGVGGVFEGLGDTIGAIPGFPFAAHWKMLLKMPRVVIANFISAQRSYYARIDEETKDRGAGKGKILKEGTSEDDPVNQ
jgi:hypothetical protein